MASECLGESEPPLLHPCRWEAVGLNSIKKMTTKNKDPDPPVCTRNGFDAQDLQRLSSSLRVTRHITYVLEMADVSNTVSVRGSLPNHSTDPT